MSDFRGVLDAGVEFIRAIVAAQNSGIYIGVGVIRVGEWYKLVDSAGCLIIETRINVGLLVENPAFFYQKYRENQNSYGNT